MAYFGKILAKFWNKILEQNFGKKFNFPDPAGPALSSPHTPLPAHTRPPSVVKDPNLKVVGIIVGGRGVKPPVFHKESRGIKGNHAF